MTKADFVRDRDRLSQLVSTGDRDAVDRLLVSLHVKYHDRPLEHVRVHVEWMRVQLARGNYSSAAFHAFAGFVIAGPASLLQRHTGLVVPAFDAEHRS